MSPPSFSPLTLAAPPFAAANTAQIQNLLAVGMAGVLPRASTALEALLLPIIAVACRGYLWHADSCAAKYPMRHAASIFAGLKAEKKKSK